MVKSSNSNFVKSCNSNYVAARVTSQRSSIRELIPPWLQGSVRPKLFTVRSEMSIGKAKSSKADELLRGATQQGTPTTSTVKMPPTSHGQKSRAAHQVMVAQNKMTHDQARKMEKKENFYVPTAASPKHPSRAAADKGKQTPSTPTELDCSDHCMFAVDCPVCQIHSKDVFAHLRQHSHTGRPCSSTGSKHLRHGTGARGHLPGVSSPCVTPKKRGKSLTPGVVHLRNLECETSLLSQCNAEYAI